MEQIKISLKSKFKFLKFHDVNGTVWFRKICFNTNYAIFISSFYII